MRAEGRDKQPQGGAMLSERMAHLAQLRYPAGVEGRRGDEVVAGRFGGHRQVHTGAVSAVRSRLTLGSSRRVTIALRPVLGLPSSVPGAVDLLSWQRFARIAGPQSRILRYPAF